MLKYLASKTSVKYAICGRNRGKMEQAVDAGIEGIEGPGRRRIFILEVSIWNHPRFPGFFLFGAKNAMI